jgi:hypothetical protein
LTWILSFILVEEVIKVNYGEFISRLNSDNHPIPPPATTTSSATPVIFSKKIENRKEKKNSQIFSPEFKTPKEHG